MLFLKKNKFLIIFIFLSFIGLIFKILNFLILAALLLVYLFLNQFSFFNKIFSQMEIDRQTRENHLKDDFSIIKFILYNSENDFLGLYTAS